jgi:hypothetical protein
LQPPNVRRREEEQDGVKGNVYEESPVRPPNQEKPKISYIKSGNFQTFKVRESCDSNMSTPKKEGGVPDGSVQGL